MALISRSARLHLVQWLGSAVVLVGATGGVVAPGLAQTPPDSAPPESAPTSAPRPTLATGGFSVEQGDRLMAEAEAAIAAQNIPLAIERLQSARQLYNQVSGFYQELFNMFVGVDTRQVNSNRALALAAAQKRDEATFQLSLILRQQNRPEEAVPLLIEVLRSQQPGRDLGQRAYRQLFDMGFVQVPHVLPGTTAPAAPAAPATGSLSMARGDQLVAEAEAAITAQDYGRAIERLRAAQQTYNRLAGLYSEISDFFVGVSPEVVTSNRNLALTSGQKRDQATFQMALIFRTQNRADEAIPLLMEILRSQQPTRELGQRAYQQLFELGFVETAFIPSRGR